MYHQIETPCKNKFYVNVSNFDEQIKFIVTNKIHTFIWGEKYYNKSLCITFDDGHKSNLDAARKLYANGIKAVFYIIKDNSLQSDEYLSPDDIREISQMGHLIGIHGKNHEWWTNKTENELISDLLEVKEWLYNITGQPITTCSAPGGRITKKQISIINKHIPELKYIRTSVCSYNKNLLNSINSIAIKNNTSLKTFSNIVTINKLYYMTLYTKYISKEIIKRILYKFLK